MLDISSESYYAQLLESAKNSNLQKLEFFFAKCSLYIVKMFAKNVQIISYTFLKSP